MSSTASHFQCRGIYIFLAECWRSCISLVAGLVCSVAQWCKEHYKGWRAVWSVPDGGAGEGRCLCPSVTGVHYNSLFWPDLTWHSDLTWPDTLTWPDLTLLPDLVTWPDTLTWPAACLRLVPLVCLGFFGGFCKFFL